MNRKFIILECGSLLPRGLAKLAFLMGQSCHEGFGKELLEYLQSGSVCPGGPAEISRW
jgi:hypothetical protein